ERVQRNRLILHERTGLDAPEIGDVTDCSKRPGNVPCQAADVRALADMRDERDAVGQFERRRGIERAETARVRRERGLEPLAALLTLTKDAKVVHRHSADRKS